MIEIKDIEEAVAKKLISNDFSVIAQEVQEGFKRPACFIEVLPVSVEVQNQFSEQSHIYLILRRGILLFKTENLWSAMRLKL